MFERSLCCLVVESQLKVHEKTLGLNWAAGLQQDMLSVPVQKACESKDPGCSLFSLTKYGPAAGDPARSEKAVAS